MVTGPGVHGGVWGPPVFEDDAQGWWEQQLLSAQSRPFWSPLTVTLVTSNESNAKLPNGVFFVCV